MTEDEQRTYGNIVSKSARHIGHVMTIGYAALILAHLIKGSKIILLKKLMLSFKQMNSSSKK